MKKRTISVVIATLITLTVFNSYSQEKGNEKIKFDKNPPCSLRELICSINALIDVQNLKVEKNNINSMIGANKALIAIGFGYNSTNKLSVMCTQFVDVINNMKLDDKVEEKIFKLSEKCYEKLKSKK